ncbi:MAG: hypothetical protein P4L83_11590 [Nevskia sp.]|nr:hypothetical protein [Nevskia sp.]
MSISGISSNASIYQQSAQASASGLGGYMQQLASALQTGNLSSAQQAFSAIAPAVQGIQGTSGSAGSSSSGGSGNSLASLLKQGLGQVGTDLQSGNISAAQSDFTKLQQQIRNALSQGQQQQPALSGHHHHHHGGMGATASTSASTAAGVSSATDTSTTSSTGSSSINVTA